MAEPRPPLRSVKKTAAAPFGGVGKVGSVFGPTKSQAAKAPNGAASRLPPPLTSDKNDPVRRSSLTNKKWGSQASTDGAAGPEPGKPAFLTKKQQSTDDQPIKVPSNNTVPETKEVPSAVVPKKSVQRAHTIESKAPVQNVPTSKYVKPAEPIPEVVPSSPSPVSPASVPPKVAPAPQAEVPSSPSPVSPAVVSSKVAPASQPEIPTKPAPLLQASINDNLEASPKAPAPTAVQKSSSPVAVQQAASPLTKPDLVPQSTPLTEPNPVPEAPVLVKPDILPQVSIPAKPDLPAVVQTPNANPVPKASIPANNNPISQAVVLVNPDHKAVVLANPNPVTQAVVQPAQPVSITCTQGTTDGDAVAPVKILRVQAPTNSSEPVTVIRVQAPTQPVSPIPIPPQEPISPPEPIIPTATPQIPVKITAPAVMPKPPPTSLPPVVVPPTVYEAPTEPPAPPKQSVAVGIPEMLKDPVLAPVLPVAPGALLAPAVVSVARCHSPAPPDMTDVAVAIAAPAAPAKRRESIADVVPPKMAQVIPVPKEDLQEIVEVSSPEFIDTSPHYSKTPVQMVLGSKMTYAAQLRLPATMNPNKGVLVQAWTSQSSDQCRDPWHGVELVICTRKDNLVTYRKSVDTCRQEEFRFTFRLSTDGGQNWTWSHGWQQDGVGQVVEKVSAI